VDSSSLVSTALAISWSALAVGAGWHVLLYKRKPQAALLWLVVIATLPFIGAVLYASVGVDRIGRRATIKELRNRAVRGELEALVAPRDEQPEEPSDGAALPLHLKDFAQLLSNVSRYRAMPGNRLEVLRGGDEFFPRLLGAIESARHSVVIETFIFDCDSVGRQVLWAMSRASERGVACHLLYDAIGSINLDLIAVADAQSKGVLVTPFAGRNWLRGRFQINLRNHRKIAVIDGRLGFVGGMNISARHSHRKGIGLSVIDYHFSLSGPAVLQLMAAFAEDWFWATGQKLVDSAYYPDLPAAGDTNCRVLPSGPDGDRGVWQRVLVAAIHNATATVRIATPYFIPDEAVLTALITAAMRGVRVEVVVPRRTDHRYVDWAMKSYFDELLEVGVCLFRRPEPFLHAKLLLVDDQWASVGSANLDPRSFVLNYELNLGVVGQEAVASIRSAFEHERDASERVTLAEWETRGVTKRAWANFWGLWSPLL